MATLASLLLRLAMDKSAYTAGLQAGKADAADFAVGVGKSMSAAAAATEAAQNRMARARSKGLAEGQNFTNAQLQAAEDAHQANLALNRAAAAAAKVGTSSTEAAPAVRTLNNALSSTKLILATFLGLAFVQFIMGATGAATNFQSQMLLLSTQARATTGEVRLMTSAVMDMAASVRTGPEELALGLYHIESVGLRGAKALDVLKVAALGARVGNANLEDVTNALVATVMSGINGIDDMSRAMGTLNGIVGSGNMRMEQLSLSMKSGVLSTFKQFGLSIQDYGAALATMTDQGIPATEAATRLRISVAQLGAPTRIAAEQLSRIGLTSRDLADEMRGPQGLIGALRLLQDHLNRSGLDATEQAQLIKAAFGGSRSSAGLLTLINSLDLMDQKMQIIKTSETDFAKVAAQQAETAAAKFQTFGAEVQVLAINLGNALLPILTAVAAALGFLASQTGIVVPVLMALLGVLTILILRTLVNFTKGLIMAGLGLAAQTAKTIGLTVATSALATAEGAAAVGMGAMVAAAGPVLVVLGLLLAALIPVAVAYGVVNAQLDKQTEALSKHTEAFATDASTSLDQLKASRKGVQDYIDSIKDKDIVGGGFKLFGLWDVFSTADRLQKQLDILDSAIAVKEQQLGIDATKALAGGMVDANGQIIDETKTLVELFTTSLEGVKQAAGSAGADAMDQMAKDIMDHQNAPLNALKTLVTTMQTALTPQQEIAQNIGILQSDYLARGLTSGIPAVVAAAEAVKKHAEDRLNELTGDAYSAGQMTTEQIAQGLADDQAIQAVVDAMKKVGGPIAAMMDSLTGTKVASTVLDSLIQKLEAAKNNSGSMANDWSTKFAPSAADVADQMKKVNDELNKTANSTAASAIKSAFSDLEASAHKFFDAVHQGNLQAIDDALKHKNALLDVKAALNQAPVTAAQKALDFQRSAIEEWRLRQAIAQAQGPAAYRDAVLALQDFLAQKHIDQMQAQVDSANKQLDKQKTANTAAAEAQKAAEDRRYNLQVQAFDRQLLLLQRYLAKHPEEWAKTNSKVLALLKSYGIDYQTAGSTLGKYFVIGLQEQVQAAKDAAALLAGAITTTVPGGTVPGSSVGGGVYNGPHPIPSAMGTWQVMKENLLYSLHPDELVAPPDVASILREFGSRPITPHEIASPMMRTQPVTPQAVAQVEPGGGTIIFQVGDEKWGELTDQKLSVQKGIYGKKRLSLSSRR